MMAVHVDDVLWSTTEKDDPVAALLTEFKIREMKKATEEEFRFCGREYNQDEGGGVRVSVKDYIKKIEKTDTRIEIVTICGGGVVVVGEGMSKASYACDRGWVAQIGKSLNVAQPRRHGGRCEVKEGQSTTGSTPRRFLHQSNARFRRKGSASWMLVALS